MSATLTTKRKSARDRPASSYEREGGLGERKREIDRRARGRSAPRHARRDDQREREGPSRSAMKAQSDDPLSHAAQLSSRSLHPPPVVGQPVDALAAHDAVAVALPLSPSYARPPASLLPPRAPPPSGLTHPADALSLSCSRHPSASRAAIDATPVCRERARMREIEGGVWRAPQKRPRPI